MKLLTLGNGTENSNDENDGIAADELRLHGENEMYTITTTATFPKLTGLAGVRHVIDVSAKVGRPAVEVEFDNDLRVTVARDEISRMHYCIWFPITAESRGFATVAAKLTQGEMIVKLNEFATFAAAQ